MTKTHLPAESAGVNAIARVKGSSHAQPTRRALIGGAGLVLTATAAVGARGCAGEAEAAQPDALAPDSPLALVAAGWLRLWTSKGGAVIRQPDGSFQIGHPIYELSPVAERDRAALEGNEGFQEMGSRWKDQTTRHHLAWNDAFYDGRMREAGDMLDACPSLADAVKAIVAEIPAAGFPKRGEGR